MGKKATEKSHGATKKTSTPVKALLSSDEISNGISSLLKTIRGSTEDKKTTYDNESSTIYLQFATNNIKGSDPIGRVTLPNPLSYIRSVCMIARGTVEDETVAPELKALIKEIGIKGKVRIVPVEGVKATIATRNQDELHKLAKAYDTFIADGKVLSDIAVQALYVQMSKLGKHVNKIQSSKDKDTKSKLKEALDKSFILPNSAKDAYVWRVGHRDMTESEVHANVTAALNVLSTWTASFPDGLAHFSAVRLANGAGANVELYANAGAVAAEKPYQRHERKNRFAKADDQLYWMNRMQQKDGKPYWKENDKATRNMLKVKPEGAQALRVQRLNAIRADRKAGAAKSPKKPWKSGTPGSAKKLSPWKAGAPGSGKKSPFKPTTPKTATPQKQVTPRLVTPLPQNGAKPGTPQNTPGSSKKRKSQGGTGTPLGGPRPLKDETPTPLRGPVPLKAETPKGDDSGSAKKMKMTPQPTTPAQANGTPGTPGTPGSGKKSRRSRKNRTPNVQESSVLGEKTPVKVETPGQSKEMTPQPTTPAQANGTPGTPGSGKKSRRSRKNRTPNVLESSVLGEKTPVKVETPGQSKEKTPAKSGTPVLGLKTPLNEKTPVASKPTTPGWVKAEVSANGASPALTPGSGKKRRRSRKNGTPVTGTPAAATPAAGTPAQAKENTPKLTTPVAAPPAMPGNVATPGSGGKRRRTRKSFMPGTPGVGTPAVATPGSDGKKSPKAGLKMRLRQRPSMGFKN